MKSHKLLFTNIALAFAITLSLSACNLADLLAAAGPAAPEQAPTAAGETIALPQQSNATDSPPSATQAQSARETYPSTPEEVVKAFVALYPDNSEQMLQYLSSNLSAKLPKSGPVGLLKFNGALSGFNIDSASVNPDPAGAIVKIRAEVGGGIKTRTFVLVKEGGHWVIDAVRIPKK